MKIISLVTLIVLYNAAIGQHRIDWDGIYVLKLSDFQSAGTQIGQGVIYSIQAATSMDFSFYMSNAEFRLTKNFNSKVNCSFNRDASYLIAPDSTIAEDLLNFARYQFDLSELSARRVREKLYNEKGVFSNVSFFQPVYDQIQTEFAERHAIAVRETDLGRNKEKLAELHGAVLSEIE